MKPTYLGRDNRGVYHSHDWERHGGHLSITYERSAVIRYPWLARFASVAEQGAQVILGGHYSNELRDRKPDLFFQLHRVTADPAGALCAAEELTEQRLLATGGAGRWSGPHAVIILDGANSLFPEEVARAASVSRLGSRLGISVILCREQRKDQMFSDGDKYIRQMLPQETEMGGLRLGVRALGRYAEEVAPNQGSAIYRPFRGERASFVIDHGTQAV